MLVSAERHRWVDRYGCPHECQALSHTGDHLECLHQLVGGVTDLCEAMAAVGDALRLGLNGDQQVFDLLRTHDHHLAGIAVDAEATRAHTAALRSAITAAQRDMGDLWRDACGLQAAHNAALSTVERSANQLLHVAAEARLWRLEKSSIRADMSIKGCYAAIDDVPASLDAHRLQLSGHIHNVSSSLDYMGLCVGAVARQDPIAMKACERIAQQMADIRSVTAPLEPVPTLQRVVSWFQPKDGSLEGQCRNSKIRQEAVIEKVDRTAGLLDERTITVPAKTCRLTYCEQNLQTALNGITILEKRTDASAGLGPPSPPPEPPCDLPPSHSCLTSDGCFL